MAKKRGHNEGSIYRMNNGTWRGQISLNGRRISKTASSRLEIQQWIRSMLNQIDEGLTYRSTRDHYKSFFLKIG